MLIWIAIGKIPAMWVDVKTEGMVGKTVAPENVEPNFYSINLFFLIFTIATLGSVWVYAIAVPFLVLGRVSRSAWKTGGQIMMAAVGNLLRIQPWLDATVDIRLPHTIERNSSPFMTVSNHRSHLDMFFLLSKIPNIRAIAKQSLLYVPFLALVMRAMKMIPVKKGSLESYFLALEKAREALRRGDPVHVFPEMSRCPLGYPGVKEFHLAPFKVAMELGVPIIPIVFINTDRAWAKGHFGISFREKVSVHTLESLFPKNYATADELRQATWDRISRRLAEN